MISKNPIKRRPGKRPTKLTISFGEPIPDILMERVYQLSDQQKLSAILENWPNSENTLAEWNIVFLKMKSERLLAALKLFRIHEKPGFGLHGASDALVLDRIFERIFPGYALDQIHSKQDKKNKWAVGHPPTMRIYCNALRKRSKGMAATKAWVEAANIELGPSHADSLEVRWRAFKRDRLVQMLEAQFRGGKKKDLMSMARVADELQPLNAQATEEKDTGKKA